MMSFCSGALSENFSRSFLSSTSWYGVHSSDSSLFELDQTGKNPWPLAALGRTKRFLRKWSVFVRLGHLVENLDRTSEVQNRVRNRDLPMERFRKLATQDNAHENGIWALVASSESNPDAVGDFVTGGFDGKLRTWRIKSDSEIAADAEEKGEETPAAGPCVELGSFCGHKLPVVGVALAKNGSTAASSSLDGTVRIWSLDNPEAESKSIQHLGVAEVWGIAVSRDGQKAVTGGTNGVVQVMDTTLGQVDQTFSIGQNQSDGKESGRRENPMVLSVALSPDDTQIAIGAHDGSVKILDVETGKIVAGTLAKHGGPVRSIAFLPSEPRTILTGSDDQLMNLYDIDAGQVTGTCRGHTGLVLSARGADNGKYLVSGGSDRAVHVWDRMMRESVYNYMGHKDSVWGVSYAVGGNRIVAVADDGCISVLDSSNADKVV